MRIIEELIEVIVLLAAATLGIAASVGFMMLAAQDIANVPQGQGVPGQPPPNGDRIAFECCIIFFSVAYTVGMTGYRLAGASEKHWIVAENAEQHLPILHLVGSVWMLAFHLPKALTGTARPVDWVSLAIGTLLLRSAAIGLRAALRKYRFFGLGPRELNPPD